MDDNMSNRALMLLVIIAVVVSIFSTALVLNAVYTYQVGSGGDQYAAAPAAAGIVSLTVPATPVAAGQVTFEVVNPEESGLNTGG